MILNNLKKRLCISIRCKSNDFDYVVFAARTYSGKYSGRGKFRDSINHATSTSVNGGLHG